METKGGIFGHLLRRLVHISILIYPLLYYDVASLVADHYEFSPAYFLLVFAILAIVAEVIRLSFGWVVIGQRPYESHYISSFTWGAVSFCLVMFLLPKMYGIPIIFVVALVDPLMGELRRAMVDPKWVAVIGIISAWFIWFMCYFWLHTPWWFAFIIAPVTVAAEWPSFKWIDDNALMSLVPMIVVLILNNFITIPKV